MSPHVRKTFLEPDLLATAPNWSPAYFVGPAVVALSAARGGRTIPELGGEIIEGWRVSLTPGTLSYDPLAADTPIYRQSNLETLRLKPAEVHWEVPRLAARWCVQPGDVVLSKFPPVRAALVSPSARRHPADANTLIVRGLPWPVAVWLALCLNRPEYAELLLLDSGLLQRVGAGALRELRVPPVPADLEPAAAVLEQLLEERHAAGESLHWLRRDVALGIEQPAEPHDLREGLFVRSPALSSESWLPEATALRAEQAALAGELGWVSIRALGETGPRDRLASPPERARALRLGDVADDLYVDAGGEAGALDELTVGRLLARPLLPGEVLLSTLGASFRVAYVDEGVPAQVFPIDGWVRVRFRETPAAWALLLASAAVSRQTAGMAIGTVQQFIPPSSLLSLHVPVPEWEVRDRWQEALERHHARRRDLDKRWGDLRSTLDTVFAAAHPPLPPRPRVLPEGRP